MSLYYAANAYWLPSFDVFPGFLGCFFVGPFNDAQQFTVGIVQMVDMLPRDNHPFLTVTRRMFDEDPALGGVEHRHRPVLDV